MSQNFNSQIYCYQHLKNTFTTLKLLACFLICTYQSQDNSNYSEITPNNSYYLCNSAINSLNAHSKHRFNFFTSIYHKKEENTKLVSTPAINPSLQHAKSDKFYSKLVSCRYRSYRFNPYKFNSHKSGNYRIDHQQYCSRNSVYKNRDFSKYRNHEFNYKFNLRPKNLYELNFNSTKSSQLKLSDQAIKLLVHQLSTINPIISNKNKVLKEEECFKFSSTKIDVFSVEDDNSTRMPVPCTFCHKYPKLTISCSEHDHHYYTSSSGSNQNRFLHKNKNFSYKSSTTSNYFHDKYQQGNRCFSKLCRKGLCNKSFNHSTTSRFKQLPQKL